MATTVLSLLTRSLSIIRVCDANDVPEASDVATALRALNAMLRRWEANGLALGWRKAESADEDASLPEEAEEPVVYNLAIRLQTEYGGAIGPEVMLLASDGLAQLRRDRAIASPMRYRSGGEYNTVTDDYCSGPTRISYP